jgi:hypothetical protein
MTIPLALFASSYNEEEANGTTIQNSKSSYTPVKNNKNNYILGNNDNNSNSINNSNDYSKNKNPNLRKTIKQKPTAPNESKLAALLKSMDESSDSENDDDSNLANYKGIDTRASAPAPGPGSGPGMFPPLPELNYKGPSSTSTDASGSAQNSNSLYTPDIPTSSSSAVTSSTYKDMPSTYANQYYKQFIPYLNEGTSDIPGQPKSELLEKLNYIIDLLEDQQDYKTNSIFEDLILYAFLGIFVIFIVDSFSKSGKYVR